MKGKLLTKRQLKAQVRKAFIEEIISGLDIGIAKHAIDVKDKDLIDVAYLAQEDEDGPNTAKLIKLVLESETYLFHGSKDCKIPPKTRIQMILIGDIYILKVSE